MDIAQWASQIIPEILLAVAGWFGVVDPVARWIYMLVLPLMFYIMGSKHRATSAGIRRNYTSFKVRARGLVKR